MLFSSNFEMILNPEFQRIVHKQPNYLKIPASNFEVAILSKRTATTSSQTYLASCLPRRRTKGEKEYNLMQT